MSPQHFSGPRVLYSDVSGPRAVPDRLGSTASSSGNRVTLVMKNQDPPARPRLKPVQTARTASSTLRARAPCAFPQARHQIQLALLRLSDHHQHAWQSGCIGSVLSFISRAYRGAVISSMRSDAARIVSAAMSSAPIFSATSFGAGELARDPAATRWIAGSKLRRNVRSRLPLSHHCGA